MKCWKCCECLEKGADVLLSMKLQQQAFTNVGWHTFNIKHTTAESIIMLSSD